MVYTTLDAFHPICNDDTLRVFAKYENVCRFHRFSFYFSNF